jgi:hypothetical protein
MKCIQCGDEFSINELEAAFFEQGLEQPKRCRAERRAEREALAGTVRPCVSNAFRFSLGRAAS